MSGWLLPLVLCGLQFAAPAVAFSVVYNSGQQGRKLFGGYRIVPKPCRPSVLSVAAANRDTPGICMFNYECSQRDGQVVGACMDGFLFGACCHLPDGATFPSDLDATSPVPSPAHDTTPVPMTPGATSPVFTHPAADTILYHENGTAVQHHESPEDLFRPAITLSHPGNSIQDTDIIYDTTPQTSKMTTEGKHTTFSYVINSLSPSTATRPVLSSIFTSVLSNDVDSTVAPQYYSSKWPSTRPVAFRPKPSYLTTSSRPSTAPVVAESPGLVLVPTITTDKKPVTFDAATNAESINHILSILNGTSPEFADPEPEPVPHFPPATTGGLSTWVSVDGQTAPTWRPGFTTIQSDEPAETTMQKLPSSTSTRPITTVSKAPAPTVIVLSPLGAGLSTAGEDTQWTEHPLISPGTKRPVTLGVLAQTETTRPTHPAIITARPSPPQVVVTNRPSTFQGSLILHTSKPVTVSTPPPVVTFTESTPLYTVADLPVSTSIAELFNFPPVRNPQLNLSFAQSQQEIPGLYMPTEIPSQVSMVEEDELLDNEITTPEFVEDDKLDHKLQGFVDKIVQSLEGNFEDLEDLLYKRRNATTTTTTRRPPTFTTTRRPSNTPTRRPTTKRPPLNNPTSTSPSKPTRRPSTPPIRPLATPSQSNRPLATQPSRPSSTYRPLSTKPRPSTTTKPTRRPTYTSPRPRPTSTKRPRPTKRSTTTSSTTNLIQQAVEAETTESVATKPSTTTTTTTTTPEPTTIPETVTTTVLPETTLVSTTTTKPVDYRTECGVRPLMKGKNGRIVGGKGSTFGEWPWQVLVRESTWLGLFTKNKCGGVLITNRFVVTAAHCQPGFLANLVAVFGEFDLSGELESKRSVTRNVRRVIVHRHYDAATFANDLALLELDSPVTYDQHIVPICMPGDGEDFTGRTATVTGWGRLKYGGGVPSVLQEVQVPVIENSVCQEMFQTAGHQKAILGSFLCAGYANGQKDSCEGDSGGPLMLEKPDGRWILVGTVSHGIKCAAPYLPGVYMRTTYYKPWLKSITGVR